MTPGNTLLRGLHEIETTRPVGVGMHHVGPADNLQESKRAGKLRRPDSYFSDQFRLAHQALVLVSRGASERDAVQRAAASDPRLTNVKREALALVLGTTSEQDVIDILVRNAHPEEKMGMSARCLFRLTTYAMLRPGARGQMRRIEHSVRAIAPSDLIPRLEFFFGTLSALNTTGLLSGLRASERVALETHHPVRGGNYGVRILGSRVAVKILSLVSGPGKARIIRR